MYCTNCKHKYEGNFCPECGAKLVEEPQPGGVSVNLGDANAISGGINVETTNNVQNVDNRVTNIDNTVNNVSQTVNNIDNSVHNIDNSIHNTTQNVTHNVTNITQVAATEADVELAAEKATQAIAASETKRAEADILKEQRHQQEIDDERRKSKKRTMIVTIAILAIIAFVCASFYVYIHTGKSLAEKASEATYNSINSKNINDIDIDTSDVPSDDESVVIDSNGDVKAQLEKYYDIVYDLSGGFYKIKKDGKIGLADKNGKIIQRPKYDYINPKDVTGLMKTELDKKYGFLNIKGVELVSPTYTNVYPMKDGMIKVEKDGKQGLLSATTFEEVAPCIYTYIYDLKDGKFKTSIDSKTGYLNADGSLLQNPE